MPKNRILNKIGVLLRGESRLKPWKGKGILNLHHAQCLMEARHRMGHYSYTEGEGRHNYPHVKYGYMDVKDYTLKDMFHPGKAV